MKITVIGTGYLGATHAACMAELGHHVLGVDVDETKIAELRTGIAPFHEPGLDEILNRGLSSGTLSFSTCLADAAQFSDVHFLCVGTPQAPGSDAADLRFVHAVIDTLVPQLTGHHLIFGKSTVPVGTAAALQARADALAAPGASVEIIWNPEFLRESHGVEDTLSPDRIVLGVADPASPGVAVAREVYQHQITAGIPFLVMDLPTAELVKASANAFLAMKISYINAVSAICDAAGADVARLAEGIGLDDRIGRKFLRAGLGYGGGCLPKDTRAFIARAEELGAGDFVQIFREVDEINSAQMARTLTLARDIVGGDLDGQIVTVLGASFKPNSDDIRESPALALATGLATAGARVAVYDPAGQANARRQLPELFYPDSLDRAVTGADLVVIATEWSEFIEMEPHRIGALVAERRIIDARNVLDLAEWTRAGWQIRGLGRHAHPATAPAFVSVKS